MRISKSIAQDVSEKLLKEKNNYYKLILEQFKEDCTVVALKYQDPEVMRTFKLFKSYFTTRSKVCFHSYINETRVELDADIKILIPVKDSSYRAYIDIQPNDFKRLQEQSNKLTRLKEEYKKANEVVTNTIYNLRTPIQVKKHFPEAYELLPKSTNGSMLPMVNLDQVRALVQINTTSNAV